MKKGCECWIVLVLIGILIVLALNLLVIYSQKNVLQDSLIPNKPVVDIWSSKGFAVYNYYNLVSGNNDLIGVDAVNIGKMNLPLVNITFLKTEYFQAYPILYDNRGLANLTPMTNRSTSFMFGLKPGMNDSLMPGEQELKFKILCPACKEQIIYDSFKICIYQTFPSQDCGLDWS